MSPLFKKLQVGMHFDLMGTFKLITRFKSFRKTEIELHAVLEIYVKFKELVGIVEQLREEGFDSSLIHQQIDKVFTHFNDAVPKISSFLSSNKIYQGMIFVEGKDIEKEMRSKVEEYHRYVQSE